MAKITIDVPDGYDIQIVRKKEKKEEPVIRTYQDLINAEKSIKGFYLGTNGGLIPCTTTASKFNINIAASEKVVKSMLAMAMISQLMPYYGGAITDEEWGDGNYNKYCIIRRNIYIVKETWTSAYQFLAFHTEEQRDNFLKYNEQLVKDYLMID